MRKFLLAMVIVSGAAPLAKAQEFGALVGVHQTTADTDVNGASVDGKFEFKAGLAVAFPLMDQFKFRTGAVFNRRHFDVKQGTATTAYKFDYLDVPANVQYMANEMFGFFGGLNIGINVNDKVSPPAGTTAADPDADTLIPLLNLGFSLMFEDMIGFDVYYERGLGEFAKDLKDFSTFGANFLYWF